MLCSSLACTCGDKAQTVGNAQAAETKTHGERQRYQGQNIFMRGRENESTQEGNFVQSTKVTQGSSKKVQKL